MVLRRTQGGKEEGKENIAVVQNSYKGISIDYGNTVTVGNLPV